MPAEPGRARTLPDGRRISAMGFGCSSLWAKPDFDAGTAAALLEQAAALGVNHFDTAPSYADGEVRLGRFVAGRDRSALVLSTKVGTEHASAGGGRSFDPDRMRRSLEGSLTRLGVAGVDILYLHGPAIVDLSDPVFRFFDDVRREGLIAFSGVNSFDPAVVRATIATPIDVVMLQYNVVDRRFDTLIGAVAAAGKTVIAGTVLAQGIFDLRTFVPRDRKSLWYLLRALKNDPLFMVKGVRLRRRAAAMGLDPHAAAIRFAVGNPHITSSLFGSTRAAHVAANIRAADAADAAIGARTGAGAAR